MGNNEDNEFLDQLIDLRKEGIIIITGILGQSLFTEDLYCASIVDKCTRLIDGFILMIESRNLTCAGVILRILLDNCLRTYALYIAENKDDVFRTLVDPGTELKKLSDKSGKKMKDYNLIEEISKLDKGFKSVYSQASAYVHHSDKAFYGMNLGVDNDEFTLGIGLELSEKYDPYLIECQNAFIHYLKFQYDLLRPIALSKERFDLCSIDLS
jgi:hypothetical protein